MYNKNSSENQPLIRIPGISYLYGSEEFKQAVFDHKITNVGFVDKALEGHHSVDGDYLVKAGKSYKVIENPPTFHSG